MASTKKLTSADELPVPDTGQKNGPTNRDSELFKALAAAPSYPPPAEIDPTALANTAPGWRTTSKAFAPMRTLQKTGSLATTDSSASGSLQPAVGVVFWPTDLPARWCLIRFLVPRQVVLV